MSWCLPLVIRTLDFENRLLFDCWCSHHGAAGRAFPYRTWPEAAIERVWVGRISRYMLVPNHTDLHRSEILEILNDLSSAGVLHGDIKFNNLLRPAFPSSVPSASSSSYRSQICPRHKRIHPWRIIDFDRATKWGRSIPQDVEHFRETQKEDFEYGYFWGGGWSWWWLLGIWSSCRIGQTVGSHNSRHRTRLSQCHLPRKIVQMISGLAAIDGPDGIRSDIKSLQPKTDREKDYIEYCFLDFTLCC